MNNISRRSFLGPAATNLLAIEPLEAEAQLVYLRADRNITGFEQLVRAISASVFRRSKSKLSLRCAVRRTDEL